MPGPDLVVSCVYECSPGLPATTMLSCCLPNCRALPPPCDMVIEQWSGVAHWRAGTNGACRRDVEAYFSHRNPHRI